MKSLKIRSIIFAGLGMGILLTGCASQNPEGSASAPMMDSQISAAAPAQSMKSADAMNRPAAAPEASVGRAKADGNIAGRADEGVVENGGETKVTEMPRRIIYTAQTQLTCADFGKAAEGLNATIKKHGGFVADSSVSGQVGENRSGTWKVRIPVARFDEFLKDLGGVGDVENTQISSADVSEEFYDLEARLKNKRIEETRLIQLLQQATGKLTEILVVEKEISRVREEIERMEGRRRLLANQTELTTIDITLRERTSLTPRTPPTLGSQIMQTFTESAVGMGHFFKGILLMLIGLFPWVVVGGAIGVPVWRIVRRRAVQKQVRGGQGYDAAVATGRTPGVGDGRDTGDR